MQNSGLARGEESRSTSFQTNQARRSQSATPMAGAGCHRDAPGACLSQPGNGRMLRVGRSWPCACDGCRLAASITNNEWVYPPSLARTASNGRAGVQRIRPADTSGEREGTWSRRGEDQGEFWINDPSRVFVARAVSMRCPPRSSGPLGIAARSRQTTGNKRRSFVGHAAVTFRVSAPWTRPGCGTNVRRSAGGTVWTRSPSLLS